ncbi:hypothetical protein BH11MYX1_BH11MYX1_10270 [soil metagenome]
MRGSSATNRIPVINVGDNVDGRYHVLSMIADGGMGTVFLAEHMLIKRRVAIKVLHRELASDRAMVERFMNEASAASKLGHPNIVESTDMGFTRDRVPFIVFEYLEGALLTEEIYRVGGLPVRRALRIAKQIASALEAAHAAKIVHLDLKTDNIFLVDKDGTSDHAKVLDFGSARFAEPDRSITERDVVMGTPEFMSPEQVSTPDEVDERSDIYSLGVVLYEMIAARRPFASEDQRLLLHRIVYERPPPLRAGAVTSELERIIFDKLLAKNPAARFSSMHEVGAALDMVLRELQPSDSIPPRLRETTPSPATVVALPAPRAKRWRMSLLGLAVLAGLAGGMFGYGQRVADQRRDGAAQLLEADANALVNLVDSSTRSAKLRAETIASSPMLRAAIETDAATIRDVVVSEHLFTPVIGEVVQIAVLGDRPVVTVPTSSPEIAPGVSGLVTEKGQLRVVASTPVLRQSGAPGGAVTISRAIDLRQLQKTLAAHTLAASLEGLDHPVTLVTPDADVQQSGGADLRVAVATPTRPLALRARLRASPRSTVLRSARYAAWLVAGLLLVSFLAFGITRRPAGQSV